MAMLQAVRVSGGWILARLPWLCMTGWERYSDSVRGVLVTGAPSPAASSVPANPGGPRRRFGGGTLPSFPRTRESSQTSHPAQPDTSPPSKGSRLRLPGSENSCIIEAGEESSESWEMVRQRGRCRQFRHATTSGTVTVSGKPNVDMPPGTFNNALEQWVKLCGM